MPKTFKKIEDIEVWQKGCRLAIDIYKITSNKSFEKDWNFRDQMMKAVISIPSNIAEGFERNSAAEFKRFLLIAKSSCGEIRTQLYIACAIGYLSKEECDNLIERCIEISSMTQSLIQYLKK